MIDPTPFWIGVLWFTVTLPVPIALLAILYLGWEKLPGKWGKLCSWLYLVVLIWIAGWFFQWFWRTHTWWGFTSTGYR